MGWEQAVTGRASAPGYCLLTVTSGTYSLEGAGSQRPRTLRARSEHALSLAPDLSWKEHTTFMVAKLQASRSVCKLLLTDGQTASLLSANNPTFREIQPKFGAWQQE